MSDYKKIMGYADKNKVVKKNSKPKKNKILENIKSDLNEWDSFKKTPKRWSKTFDGNTGLTEFEMGKIYTDKDRPPFKTEQKINETIPAFAKEWKNLQKSCDTVYKSIDVLAKSVGKVDKKQEREVRGLGKYVSSHLKKFKELLSKEVLDKLQ